jgi:energy-coupling factor transporter ATP-binding protein EcfA2
VNVLSLKGIRFKYPGAGSFILDGLDLEVAPGEAVQIFGSSGGGKSTLCMISSSLIPCRQAGEFAGFAELDGISTIKLGPIGASSIVGYVSQNPEQMMVMPTVEEEIAFGLENRGWEAIDISARVEDLIDKFNMISISSRNPSRLSGGETQLVALASSIAHHPRLLILDEALSGLDDERRLLANDELQKLKVEGCSILLVEHEKLGREPTTWIDRRMKLEGGKLTEVVV